MYSYTCPNCGEHVLFAAKGKLLALPVLRPYSCATCKKSFASTDALAQHQRDAHGT